MQFYIAGTDTTSSQLYLFYLFAGLYPEVQEKIYQEIKEVLGEHMQLCIKNMELEPQSLKFNWTRTTAILLGILW